MFLEDEQFMMFVPYREKKLCQRGVRFWVKGIG